MNLAHAEFLFALLLLITAYLLSHTLNGCIQTFVCSKLGDDTAKDAGFLSLNPLVHIDLFGFLALIFLGIGWMQTVPIDPYSFVGGWRYWRLFVAYATEACVSVCIAIISLFLAVFFYGYQLTAILIAKLFTFYSKAFMIFFSSGAHLKIAADFAPNESSLVIALAYLLVSLVYLNILIATISLIFNAFRYALVVGFEKGYTYVEYAEYVSFFGPFLVVYVFGDQLVYYLLKLSEWGAVHIAHLVGSVL